MQIIKSMQLSASPCFTPFSILYPNAAFPFKRIWLHKSLYKVSKIGMKLVIPKGRKTFFDVSMVNRIKSLFSVKGYKKTINIIIRIRKISHIIIYKSARYVGSLFPTYEVSSECSHFPSIGLGY